MKKIININLSGRVIPIEDSAYEKLQGYIESLRRYFANEEGRDEIINDIESRIAELMNEKVRKGASGVTDADIDEIIASMGRPEDFDAEAAAEAADSSKESKARKQEYTSSERRAKGRLYRDTNDKFIGGVCSGIAAYLNTDPAIVRILFAIITFGGFGIGFLIYILLWMFLPTKDLEGYYGKRLYRNPDERMIGGVAGGLAAYFNRDVKTIRLIFAAPIILSVFFGLIKAISWHYYDFSFFPNVVFGSLTSTFIVSYIVLWAVLPEARSPYEKMEMRGEKVDVNTIRQNVKDGMDNMKERMKDWSEEVKESAQNLGNRAKEFANTRGKTFATEFGETARRSTHGVAHVIGVLFKVFFLFIAGSIAFGLFVAFMALLFGGIAWWPVNNFLWTSQWQQVYAWGTLIFFLGVPLVGLITWIIRRIIGVRSRSGYLGWTFGFLWTLGWVSAVLLASSLSRDFRYEYIDNKQTIAHPSKERLIVTVSQPPLEYTGRFNWMNDGGNGWNLTDDSLQLSAMGFTFSKSPDSVFHVTVKKFAYGRSRTEAMQRAAHLSYPVTLNDSLLDLGNGYGIGRDDKYRFQHIELDIQVPAGKKIRFDHSVNDKLNSFNFRIHRGRHGWANINTDGMRTVFSPDIDYTMGIDGELKDPSGRNILNWYNNSNVNNNDDDYRYDELNNNSDSTELRQRLDEEKRKREESDKIIKDLEEKQKKQGKPAGKQEKPDSNKAAISLSGPAIPALSMVTWF